MRIPALFASALIAVRLLSQDTITVEDVYEEVDVHQAYLDSIEAALTFQQGVIPVGDGVATLNIPDSFKFLGAEQSRLLIVDLWENPPSVADGVFGVIFPADAGIWDDGFAFIVQYDPIGYVSDADADGIDYNAMMVNMLKEDQADNLQRQAEGYDRLLLVGWASPPYYDKQRKVLHWAKEMRRDSVDVNALNYNIRVLGRKGVLILNAVGTMTILEDVKANIPTVLDMATFNDGYRYDQYDPKVDDSANLSLGGLIDGQAKERIKGIAMLVVKVAAIAIGALILIVGLIWYFLVRRKRNPPMA